MPDCIIACWHETSSAALLQEVCFWSVEYLFMQLQAACPSIFVMTILFSFNLEACKILCINLIPLLGPFRM